MTEEITRSCAKIQVSQLKGGRKVRRVVSLVVLLAFLVVFVGCASLSLESKMDKPVSMTKMKGSGVRDFSVESRAIWLFWGLVPMSVPKVDDIVGPQMADRGGVRNLKITTRGCILDILVTTVTQGIITMRSVRIQGEVYD